MTIPQTVLDPETGRTADELIAPLILLVERYGLTVRTASQGVDSMDPEVLQPAFLSFPDAQDGLEFLLQTAHMNDYQIGEHLSLSIHRPLGPHDGPNAQVRFLPEAIPWLILLWTKILPPSSTTPSTPSSTSETS
jgi:hypothetical protein